MPVPSDVPGFFTAALPVIDVSPPPASPYYLFAEASAYTAQAAQAQPEAGAEDRVTAQPYSLPGVADLKAMLAEIAVGHGHTAAQPALAGPDRRFYFVDPVAAGTTPAPTVAQGAHPPFDVHAIRRDFPILSERVNGRQLVWFDNAATTQKPHAVIDRLAWFYAHENSNIHRAAHELAARATDAYEGARSKVARFLGRILA